MSCDRERLRSEPAELDARRITGLLRDPGLSVRIEPFVDSTNTRLAEIGKRGERVDVLLAEQQTAGRGRQGRQWLSPPRRGLYLSMAWHFTQPIRVLGALALVAGLAAAEALNQHSAIHVGVKWPNDLQIGGRKLGGCLIDLSTHGRQRTSAIIGIGINVDLTGFGDPGQPWTDLVREGGSRDRSALAAALINSLHRDLGLFARSGFAAFQSRWRAHDALYGQTLQLFGPVAEVTGRGLGVDASGGLLLQTSNGVETIRSGEVSVRAAGGS